jgi:hypothetical protein
MTQVKPDDTIAIQVVIGRVFSPSTLPNKVADPHASIFSVLCGNIPPASNESRNQMKEKVSSHRVSALIRIGAKSTFGFQSDDYLRNVVSALRVMESSGVRISASNEKPDYFNRAIAHGIMR